MSLRTAWTARFPSLPLRSLQGARNRFYAEHPEAFPDRGLRGLIASLSWPARLQPPRRMPADYPRDATPGWTQNLNGVAVDDTHWYITQVSSLHKVPLSHDLGTSIEGFPIEPLPEGFDHFGDLDVRDEVVYVSLEGNEQPGIATYDTNLRLLATKELPDQQHCPWCAVNPKNGLVYSSEFDAGELRVYRPFLTSVVPVGAMPLFDEDGRPLEIKSIQGGAFSPLGHLYLLSDEQDGGIMGFDMITGRRVLHTLVDYQKFLSRTLQAGASGIGAFIGAAVGSLLGVGLGLGGALLGGVVGFLMARHFAGKPIQELEGLALWNADGRAPGIGGQLHVQMIGLIPPRENQLFFKHYEADDERKDL